MNKGAIIMCGISGIINYEKNIIEERKRIQSMNDALIHRGPDAFGYYYHENALLGHRRLIVIDPKGGQQPMTYKYQFYEYTIVYNGELYNTEEVRKELIENGYYFDSYSDTEVILKAYALWGEDCVLHFNGIFAFAIWESLSKTIFLARDRVGVKPLFYINANGYFAFASEIKSLLKTELIKPIFNENSLLELFSLGPSRVLGSGIYKDIYELLPAQYMYITPSSVTQKIYWKPETKDHVENIKATTEHVSFLIEDAIKKQLVSDMPICTFLSGGLDSSAISSIASQHQQQVKNITLNTYSIDYEGNNEYFKEDSFQPSNDNLWVDRVSQYINSNHTRVELGIEALAETLYQATDANDYPGMADIDSSLMLFCKAVKQKHTVALSGECADEIFGGYPWYRNYEDITYEGFPWIKHLDVRKSFLSDNIKSLNLKEFAYENYKKTVDEIEYLEYENKYDKGIRRLTYLNYKWFMVTLLTRKDRMSMNNSLEVRVPYADHRIIDYTYNIPWTMKYMNNIEKGLLRSALTQHLPDDVVYRKKSPYPKTYNPKYEAIVTGLLKSIIDKESSPINSLINKDKVNNLIKGDINMFETPWFGQLMKGPQFLAYLIQLNYFLEKNNIAFEGI
jgi:asparagine synthase (glutamine-hydrolysing)